MDSDPFIMKWGLITIFSSIITIVFSSFFVHQDDDRPLGHTSGIRMLIFFAVCFIGITVLWNMREQ